MNLKTLSLALAIILFASLTSAQQQKQPPGEHKSFVPDPVPLEIKGDRIGETVAQFKIHYPNAGCGDRTPEIHVCSQTQNVSLAGLTTESEACSPPQTGTPWHWLCTMQGVQARFYKGKLQEITYTFAGDFTHTLCEAFAEKYGKPRDKVKGRCSWARDRDNVILWAATYHQKGNADFDLTTVELSDSTASKDI
jgi:hypothetical protein